MPDREEFSFNTKDLGIVSTEELIDAGENFLDSEPENIKFVQQETAEEKAAKLLKQEEENKKKTTTKQLPKQEVITPNELSEDDILNDDTEEGDDEEEEADETSKTKSKTPPKPGEEAPKEDNVFSSIAKELFQQGVFSEDLDEQGLPIPVKDDLDAEGFLGIFQTQTKKQAADIIDKFIGQFGDEYKDMFQNVFVNGVDPVDYLSRYTKIENIKSLDLADEGNQERVVRELYKSEGRSAEYVEKRITQLKNYSDLLDEATEAQRILAEREENQIKKAGETKQAEIARQQQIKSEYVNNVNKIISDKLKAKEFDGIPVDKKFADNIYSYITKEKYQTADKQLLTEFDKDILDLKRPENHEMKVKLAMLLQLAKTDPKLSTLAKKAVSKETNTLFNGLRKTAAKTNPSKEKEQEEENKTKSWFSSK